jgi:hypothetical protein
MKISDLLTSTEKDKTEITKQQQAEIKKFLDYRLIPHENHVVFEFNVKTKKINLAEYLPPNKTIHWFEALEFHKKTKNTKVNMYEPKPITKSEIIKKQNCIYISALNKENALKIIQRDFGYKINKL